MRFADAATLVAVGVVVLLVSLPRLKEFALRENEGDARALTVRLGRWLAAQDGARVQNAGELVERDEPLAKQLDDLEVLGDGRLLRRHGYLFEVLEGPASTSAGATVRAWPWRHSKTGMSAFAWTADQRLLGDPNLDGAWSGLDSPPEVAGAEWRVLGPR
jgi:hypothetical protein